MTSTIPNLQPPGTFMGVPYVETVRPGQGVILGVPFDCGTHPTRIGSRQGPRAIREQSSLVRPYYPVLSDTNILEEMDVVDAGDVSVVSSQIEQSLQNIEQAASAVFEAGGYPVGMGGDGLVSLPLLRAAGRHHPGLVVLHIDAHTDAYDLPGFNTSTTFTRAAEEKVIDAQRSFHVGARGSLAVRGAYDFTRSLGYNLLLGEDVRRLGIAEILRQIQDVVDGRPVYLCFDMDYIDPSAAPGVATPTWGGPDAASALELLHGLSGLNIVAADVNTVSPSHDVGGMTAYLAGHVMMVALHLMALGRNRRSGGV